MPSGSFRRVILIDRFAVKVPRFRNFIAGMRCNRWEREMWWIWRPKFNWENLCPIIFSDSIGIFVVMQRATQPVLMEEVIKETPDYYPQITSEFSKPEDFGRIENRIVAIDNGLCTAKLISDTREYFKNK